MKQISNQDTSHPARNTHTVIESQRLVTERPGHKMNPNPWDIVTFDDIDTWEADFSHIEAQWFYNNPTLTSPIRQMDERPAFTMDAPDQGDVILVKDNDNEYTFNAPQASQNFFANHAMFIILSKSGFNDAMPFSYGMQIHPVPFDAKYMSEPAYERYQDSAHGINGTLDKMQLRTVGYAGYTLINHLSARQLADLQFDLRNIFDMN